MLRLMLCVGAAVFALILVQSTNPIINIHRSSSSKTSCQKVSWLGGDSDSICESESEDLKDSTYQNGGIIEASTDRTALFYSLVSAFLVGLSGILPLVTIRNISDKQENSDALKSKSLNRLLSFAVGSLLGDVFLHLLPETWNIPLAEGETFSSRSKANGLWVMAGLLCFCALEKFFPDEIIDDESTSLKPVFQNSNGNNNILPSGNGIGAEKPHGDYSQDSEDRKMQKNIKMSGYLNLLANFTDNFTHGLAIGGSYFVSYRVGILTTAAILLHEIPHEFGDFAILLRAGFEPLKAAKLQIQTATGGMLGALVAHSFESDGFVALILPFTSGGFLYIALCTVVPDLVKEAASTRESIIHLTLMIFGVGVMGLVGFIE